MTERETDKDPALVSLEKALIKHRDEAEQDMAAFPNSREYNLGIRNGLRFAIHTLHAWTNGAYGQSYTDQTEGQK